MLAAIVSDEGNQTIIVGRFPVISPCYLARKDYRPRQNLKPMRFRPLKTTRENPLCGSLSTFPQETVPFPRVANFPWASRPSLHRRGWRAPVSPKISLVRILIPSPPQKPGQATRPIWTFLKTTSLLPQVAHGGKTFPSAKPMLVRKGVAVWMFHPIIARHLDLSRQLQTLRAVASPDRQAFSLSLCACAGQFFRRNPQEPPSSPSSSTSPLAISFRYWPGWPSSTVKAMRSPAMTSPDSCCCARRAHWNAGTVPLSDGSAADCSLIAEVSDSRLPAKASEVF